MTLILGIFYWTDDPFCTKPISYMEITLYLAVLREEG